MPALPFQIPLAPQSRYRQSARPEITVTPPMSLMTIHDAGLSEIGAAATDQKRSLRATPCSGGLSSVRRSDRRATSMPFESRSVAVVRLVTIQLERAHNARHRTTTGGDRQSSARLRWTLGPWPSWPADPSLRTSVMCPMLPAESRVCERCSFKARLNRSNCRNSAPGRKASPVQFRTASECVDTIYATRSAPAGPLLPSPIEREPGCGNRSR